MSLQNPLKMPNLVKYGSRNDKDMLDCHSDALKQILILGDLS